jgi:hypothetical protein
MLLWDEVNRASKHQIETTSINGEIRSEVILHPSWQVDYADYLARYNQENKNVINNQN